VFTARYALSPYTGRFIMFSVITNIYNKKTKGPTLMELFTATRKQKKVFFFLFDNYRFSMCAPRVTRYMSIRCSSSCHIHTSTRVHRYSSQLQWSVPLGQRGHVTMVLCVRFTKCRLYSNHMLTHVIFQHTKRLLPRIGHFLTTYTCISERQKCELRWKATYWEKVFLLFLLSV